MFNNTYPLCIAYFKIYDQKKSAYSRKKPYNLKPFERKNVHFIIWQNKSTLDQNVGYFSTTLFVQSNNINYTSCRYKSVSFFNNKP